MIELRAEGLSKHYDDVEALAPTDLTIAPGEFFSLLGPSGCGKTTTLRLVAGLEMPTGGRLWFGERDVTHLATHRRGLGMVFQNYALFPYLSVGGNVAYGLRARRIPREQIAGRVATALARVRLAGHERRRIDTLSGGMQQRVALARALALEPDLLLLDEPLSNLDAALRLETRTELRALQREVGATTLYVTHDQDEALALSDRLAVMRAGRVQQVGAPRDVYQHPANAFVATFLGRANLAPVTVEGRDASGWAARLADGTQVRGSGPCAAEPGAPALLCLRPEALRPAPAGDGLPARAGELAFRGAQQDLAVEVAGRPWVVQLGPWDPTPWPPGTPLSLTWSPAAASLLPPEAPG